MDAERFDRWIRSLAAPRTRRGALRLAAGGLVGAALAGRGARPAAAALCPERVPKPDHTPQPNGCGPVGIGGPVVPDTWRRATFTGACDAHDTCYETCNSSKDACDRAFLRDLYAECRRVYPGPANRGLLDRCRGRAHIYYEAVWRLGQGPYEAAQGAACDCCPAGQENCGDRCVDTKTDRKNCGRCGNACGPCERCREGRCVADEAAAGGGSCQPQKVFCNCTGTCYDDVNVCLGECHATLGCFTGICAPAEPGQC